MDWTGWAIFRLHEVPARARLRTFEAITAGQADGVAVETPRASRVEVSAPGFCQANPTRFRTRPIHVVGNRD